MLTPFPDSPAVTTPGLVQAHAGSSVTIIATIDEQVEQRLTALREDVERSVMEFGRAVCDNVKVGGHECQVGRSALAVT